MMNWFIILMIKRHVTPRKLLACSLPRNKVGNACNIDRDSTSYQSALLQVLVLNSVPYWEPNGQ
jgi:hypothetical protein